MNTIEEILKNKKRKTLTEESIYDTYKRVLCPGCSNRDNNEDLCEIRVTIDKKAMCVNYKCLTQKCHGCDDESKCFNK